MSNRGLFLDQDGSAFLTVHFDREDRLGSRGRLISVVGKFDGAGLHSPTRENLALEDDGPPAEFFEGDSRLLGIVDDPALTER